MIFAVLNLPLLLPLRRDRSLLDEPLPQLHEHARGFATNVANYNPLGLPCPAEAFSRGETPAHYCRWVATSAPCCTQWATCMHVLL